MRFFIPVAAAAIALPLLATACSPATSTSGPATKATSAAPANPNAGLLTGTQLKALLAPASWFPSGFQLDPNGSVDTGSGYQPPSPPGKLTCSRLDATSWIELSGVGGVSFAQDDYVNHSTSEQYAQEIDVYRGTSAQGVMAGLRKLASTCPHFRDAQTSSTVTVKLKQGPHLGDDALTFLLKSPRWAGGTALEAVRVGTAVVSVLFSASAGTGKTQATKLATLVTTNLKNKA